MPKTSELDEVLFHPYRPRDDDAMVRHVGTAAMLLWDEIPAPVRVKIARKAELLAGVTLKDVPHAPRS
jgi:hypothetical protein